jgi:hypothetical protein
MNSGAVFWNLEKARQFEWSRKWRNLLEVAAIKRDTLNHYPFGDQDVFNLICQEDPTLCSIVSNDWNYQLIDVHSHKYQYSLHGVRVFHGNNRAFIKENEKHLKCQAKALWEAFAGGRLVTGPTQCSYLRQARNVFEMEFSWLGSS